MRYLNRALLIGNVANDVKFVTSDSGQTRCSFLLITNRSFTNAKGELVEQQEPHHVTAWGKWAAFINENVKKGKLLYVEGHMHTHHLPDEGGAEKRFTEVVVHELIILSPKEAQETMMA